VVAGVGGPGARWQARRDVAAAILTYQDVMLPDPESHLVAQFGVANAPQPALWCDICAAMAQAKSAWELQTGVADVAAQVVRAVSTPIAAAAGQKHSQAFASTALKACES